MPLAAYRHGVVALALLTTTVLTPAAAAQPDNACVAAECFSELLEGPVNALSWRARRLTFDDISALRGKFLGWTGTREPGAHKVSDKRALGSDKSFGGSGGISKDGTTAVCFADKGPDTRIHACRFTDSDGLVDLGTLDPSNDATLGSFAFGVNADGSVVVGVSDLPGGGSNQHAFRWTQSERMVDLGSAKGANGFSSAYATGADDSVVVGESDFPSGARRAFRWTAASGFLDLDSSGAGLASGISGDGSTVVGANKTHAFRWTETGGMQDLPTLPGRSGAAATAVSDNGKVVVGMSAPRPLGRGYSTGWDFETSDTRAFRWTAASGTQDLTELLAARSVDTTGITLLAALAISPDGQFIGGAMTQPGAEPNVYIGFIAQICDDAVDTCSAGGSG